MCVIDFDPPKFISHVERRARRSYTCDECSVPIEPGDVYEHTSGMWEGARPDRFRRCLGCVELAAAVTAVECSWCYESLLDDAHQAVHPFSDHHDDAVKMGRLCGLLWLANERCDESRADRWAARKLA